MKMRNLLRRKKAGRNNNLVFLGLFHIHGKGDPKLVPFLIPKKMTLQSKKLILEILAEEAIALRTTWVHMEFNLNLPEELRLTPIEDEDAYRIELANVKKRHDQVLTAKAETQAL